VGPCPPTPAGPIAGPPVVPTSGALSVRLLLPATPLLGGVLRREPSTAHLLGPSGRVILGRLCCPIRAGPSARPRGPIRPLGGGVWLGGSYLSGAGPHSSGHRAGVGSTCHADSIRVNPGSLRANAHHLVVAAAAVGSPISGVTARAPRTPGSPVGYGRAALIAAHPAVPTSAPAAAHPAVPTGAPATVRTAARPDAVALAAAASTAPACYAPSPGFTIAAHAAAPPARPLPAVCPSAARIAAPTAVAATTAAATPGPRAA
jgi:hypothetical protein